MAATKGVRVTGECDLVIETNHFIKCHEFYVAKGSYGSLLGYSTAKELNLVKITQHIKDMPSTLKYPYLFDGIGKLKGTTVKLHIDNTVKSIAQKPRRVHFYLRTKVQQEIEKLEEQDIIEKAQE
ncbi:predicted protein [Nematostella vectensis]|uniref:Uncharacterized protein n=1 Tax=Nematostella vectensis TaxID=45351 RepID=A7S4F6_NEMVE|nr:predicted protein [Nematostella vectensis]|eukprot:XP_001633468.1 predicted protein [Nematostella vectensis]